MNSVLRLIHAKARLLMSIKDISTIGRAVKLEDGMRADQESTRRFHQRRSSAVETPTVLRLNKGEARNALARAVFFNRQGELRGQTFESQRYRASGLNLVVLAIILWNTIYLERAINALREHGIAFPDSLLTHVYRSAGSTST